MDSLLNTLKEHNESTSTWFGLTEQHDRSHVTPNKAGPHLDRTAIQGKKMLMPEVSPGGWGVGMAGRSWN